MYTGTLVYQMDPMLARRDSFDSDSGEFSHDKYLRIRRRQQNTEEWMENFVRIGSVSFCMLIYVSHDRAEARWLMRRALENEFFPPR